jgi:HK97 family phage portal protein
MSFIENLLRPFRQEDRPQPAVTWFGISWMFSWPGTINYELFYKLYRSSTDLRRVIQEKQSVVWQYWREVYDWEWNVVEWEDYENIVAIFNNTYLGTKLHWKHVKERLVRDMDLTGNRYIFKVRNEAREVIGIQPLDPRYLTIVADEFGNIYGYLYRVRGNYQSFEKDDVVADKMDSDPDNEIYGFSIMHSLVVDIMADDEASKANLWVFRNNMIPAQLIVLEPNISENEAKWAIENMKAMFSWGANKWKAGIIKWIKEIIKIQNTAEDMQYLDLRKFTTEKICSAFGVPKVMLGLSEWVNYSNANIMYKEFIQNTIKPEEYAIAEMMTEIIKEQYPDYHIQFIDAHIDDIEQKITMYIKALENWMMTLDEVREELGFTPYNTYESTKPLIKATYKLLEDAWADAINLDLRENGSDSNQS